MSISEALHRCSSEGQRHQIVKSSAVTSCVAKCAEVEFDDSSGEECTPVQTATHSRVDRPLQFNANQINCMHQGFRRDGSVLVPQEASVFRINVMKRLEQTERTRKLELSLGRGGRMAAAAGYLPTEAPPPLQREISSISRKALEDKTLSSLNSSSFSFSSSLKNSLLVSKQGSMIPVGASGRTSIRNRSDFLAIGATVLIPNMKTLERNSKRSASAETNKFTAAEREKKRRVEKTALDKEIELLLGKKSLHAEDVQDEWLQTFEKKLNKQEYREKKIKEENEIKVFHVRAFQCMQCSMLTELCPQPCKDKKHNVIVVSTTKRLFECMRCRKKSPLLGPGIKPLYACRCGNSSWTLCGVHGSGQTSSKDHVGIFGEKLVTAASEWSTSGDIDKIKMGKSTHMS